MKLLFSAVSLSLLALVGCNASGGGVYFTQNSLQGIASPTKPGDFEILQQAPNGASDYWCAAGDYAIRKLGASPTARIYLRKPSGPAEFRSGRNSVGYTIAPSPELRQRGDALPGRLTMSMSRVGENWGAEHARSTCQTQERLRGF